MKYLYWLIPILLFVLQAIYTFHTFNQIRFEELDESIVNPYWVQNRFVPNGASANLGWHFLLLFVYNIFGFGLFYAKFVRLALVLISLFCLAGILKKYLGEKRAWLPLLTIGLSPTFLYFNTQQTVYGIDLVYLPIGLFIASFMKFKGSWGIVSSILLWSFLMFAWMSYPSFIYLLPAFWVFYLWRLFGSFRNIKKLFLIKNVLVSIGAFILPLLASYAYIRNRNLLIYDDNIKSGMFRGAGHFDFHLSTVLSNLKFNLINLFFKSSGYYWEAKKVEFSDFYPIISVVFIFIACFLLWRRKKALRLPILLSISIIFVNVVLAYFTVDPTPGLRRFTGVVAAIYILFTFSWYFALGVKKKSLRWLCIFVFVLLFMHHLIVYPLNLVHLSDASQFRENVWFKGSDNPRAVLQEDVEWVARQDARLMCYDESQKALNCRYNQIFAAIAGYCYWNKLVCRQITGYDPKTKQFIPLTIELFNEYYFGKYGREIIAT